MKRYNKGMSLTELLVTIGITIALIGLIMPAISVIRNNSREAEAMNEINQLDTALISFFTDNGSFPKSNQMLASLSNKYFNFDPKRLDGDSYKDHWGKSYLYICPGIISSKGYDIFSLGLLMSQGAKGIVGEIISRLSSSIFTSGSGSGTSTSGLAGKDIWGLTEPTYSILVKAMLALLRSTDVGFELAVMINIANVPIELTDLSGTGALALYDPDGHVIYVDITYAVYGPIEVVTAFLAHEATHLADHLASGDMDFDSIEEEYDAKYNEVMVWQELTEGKTFQNLSEFSQESVDMLNEELAMIMKGEEAAKEELRQRYPWLPEEDQWGDSYVVAKEY